MLSPLDEEELILFPFLKKAIFVVHLRRGERRREAAENIKNLNLI